MAEKKASLVDIATSKIEPTGTEWRDMRLAMGMTQVELGSLLFSNEQAVRRWETEKSRLGGPKSRIIRILYLQHIEHLRPSFTALDLCKRLARLELFA